MKNVFGIILAAGSGSRLKKNIPKGLTKIDRKIDIFNKIINNFKENNIKNITIITGYKKNLIEKKYKFTKKIFNPRWKTHNMFSSLLKADKILKSNSCIISYSDIFFSKTAVSKLISSKSEISICYYSNWLNLWKLRFKNPLDDAETFQTNKNSYITNIGKKPLKLKNIKGQYMGLLYIKPTGWKKLKSLTEKNKFLEKLSITELFSYAIKKNINIKGMKYNKLFFEIDSTKDLQIMRRGLQKIDIDNY